MDRQIQAHEIRKLFAGPDFTLGSVNATTEDGVLLVTSANMSCRGTMQVRKVLPSGSFVGKTLIIERKWLTGRMTVILVRQPIGI